MYSTSQNERVHIVIQRNVIRLPSLVEVDDEDCVIAEASDAMSGRHDNDKSEHIVDKRVKCLQQKPQQNQYKKW